MSSKTMKRQHRDGLRKERARRVHQQKIRKRLLGAAVAVVVLLVAGGLYVVYRSSNHTASNGTGHLSYQVGRPGIGQTAPGFDLASSAGGKLSLASLRGKTVLLYFQEGLSCQPCWDQIRDLERARAKVKAAGVDEVVSVTTDPANLIARKAADEHLATPVLSDPNLAVSKAYHANDFGMMGTSRDGHTFVLVDPTGKIRWRADYGGAPKYTMYVKVDTLLADLKAGRR